MPWASESLDVGGWRIKRRHSLSRGGFVPDLAELRGKVEVGNPAKKVTQIERFSIGPQQSGGVGPIDDPAGQ